MAAAARSQPTERRGPSPGAADGRREGSSALPPDRASWRARHWAIWAWDRLPRVNPTVAELLAVIRRVPREVAGYRRGGCRRLVLAYIRSEYQWEAYRRRGVTP